MEQTMYENNTSWGTTVADLVILKNNQVLTTSLKVAETFEKEHRNVLADIRGLFAADFSAAKFFQESTFENRGKKYPMFYMNRDGFTLLAMGFTGQKALQFKMAYIEAFNQMEETLKNRQQPVTMTQAELIAALANQGLEHERQLKKHDQTLDSHEAELKKHTEQISKVEDKTITLEEKAAALEDKTAEVERTAKGIFFNQEDQQVEINDQNRRLNDHDDRISAVERKVEAHSYGYPNKKEAKKLSNWMYNLATQHYEYMVEQEPDQVYQIDVYIAQIKKFIFIHIKGRLSRDIHEEFEEAKIYYMSKYYDAKAKDNDPPKEILRPSEIRKLSEISYIASDPELWQLAEEVLEGIDPHVVDE